MSEAKSYFFCGIGGSGMLPLALIVQGRGHEVAGSDRTLDQGRLAAKFEFLRARGIGLFPQDGSAKAALVRDAIPEPVEEAGDDRRVRACSIEAPTVLAPRRTC